MHVRLDVRTYLPLSRTLANGKTTSVVAKNSTRLQAHSKSKQALSVYSSVSTRAWRVERASDPQVAVLSISRADLRTVGASANCAALCVAGAGDENLLAQKQQAPLSTAHGRHIRW